MVATQTSRLLTVEIHSLGLLLSNLILLHLCDRCLGLLLINFEFFLVADLTSSLGLLSRS